MFDAKKVKDEIINWIRGYFNETGAADLKAVVGISGGKDSSIVAALCKEAIGKERILGVLMPNGEQDDIEYAYDLCKFLDIEYVEINIEKTYNALSAEIENKGLKLNEAAVFNTPARLRMTALYAVCGSVSGRVANTCNLSENWVGYSTKFGDSAGDFAPLFNLTVTEVKVIGKELSLPLKFIDKTPLDGLTGKTDEDNLGFSYEVLDRYIRENVCEDINIKSKIDILHENNLHKLKPIPTFMYKSE